MPFLGRKKGYKWSPNIHLWPCILVQYSPSWRTALSFCSLLHTACSSKPPPFPYLHKWWCSHPNYQGNPLLPPSSTSPLAAALSLLRVLLADGTGASSAHWLFLEEEESDSPAGSQKRPNHSSMINLSVWSIPKASIKVVLSQPALLGGKKGAQYGPEGLHYCPHMDQVCSPHTAELCKPHLKSPFLYCSLSSGKVRSEASSWGVTRQQGY